MTVQDPTQGIRAGLLTVDDVARLMACSSRSVYRLSDAGRIPRPMKIGGLVRWSATEVETWIKDGCPDCRPADLRISRTVKARNEQRPT